MESNNFSFIVTGMHRSGTTILGKLLAPAVDHLIHEPFNAANGHKMVDCWYPTPDKLGTSGNLDILRDLHRGRIWISKKTPRHHNVPLVGKIIGLAGGRLEYQMAQVRLAHWLMRSPKVAIKDPFISMLTPTIAQETNIKVIAIIRHPAAVYTSIKKMGWDIFVPTLFSSEYRKRFEAQFGLSEKTSQPMLVGALWSTICSELLNVNHGQVKVVTHEDLCVRPFEVIESLLTHINEPWTPTYAQLIELYMHGNTVNKADSKLHQFKRHANLMPLSWKEVISAEEEKILAETCGPLVERVYGAWLPQIT